MQRQQTKADPFGMTTRKAKARQKRADSPPDGIAQEVEIFRFRATSAGATLSASGKRTLLDRKPAVTRAPKQQARNRLELYLEPRSAPLWFAQPVRPRQGATRNFARTAVRIQRQAWQLQSPPSEAACRRLLPV